MASFPSARTYACGVAHAPGDCYIRMFEELSSPGRSGGFATRLRSEIRGLVGSLLHWPANDAAWIASQLARRLFGQGKFLPHSRRRCRPKFLLPHVLRDHQGNCLGLSGLLLTCGEALGLPLHPVLVRNHLFVRYDDGAVRQNIETMEGGRSRRDGAYAALYLRGGHEVRFRGYMRNLTRSEFRGLLLTHRAVDVFVQRGDSARALEDLAAAGEAFPELPHVHFNRAIICTAIGVHDYARTEMEEALWLDPHLEPIADWPAMSGLSRRGWPAGACRTERRSRVVAAGETEPSS